MVGMAPVSLAILHHLKASYDPQKKTANLRIHVWTFESWNLLDLHLPFNALSS